VVEVQAKFMGKLDYLRLLLSKVGAAHVNIFAGGVLSYTSASKVNSCHNNTNETRLHHGKIVPQKSGKVRQCAIVNGVGDKAMKEPVFQFIEPKEVSKPVVLSAVLELLLY
jgi:hypothetical protein